MKKTRLYFLLTALLFAGSAMAQSFYFSPNVTPKNEDVTKLVTADGSANIAVTTSGSKSTTVRNLTSTPTSIVDGKTAVTTTTPHYKLGGGKTITFTTTTVSDIKVLFAVGSTSDCSLTLTNQAGVQITKVDGTKTNTKTHLVPLILSATNCAADTYTITAVSKEMYVFEILVTYASAKDDATLNSITVNGEKVEGFAPETTEYNVALPVGTTKVPVVAATATSSNAEVSVTQAESVEGTATITVTAEDGTTKKTYTIHFSVAAASQDATLSAITVDGEALEGFSPEQLTYSMELAYGTTIVPTVTATTTDKNATSIIKYVDAEGKETTSLPCTATITVTAEDETTTQTYTINFTVATCSFAELALSVDSIGAIIETADLVAPTLANPHNLSVVYASSNKEVVTVDQTGALTKVGVGKAVITITAAKQTVEGIEYCEDEVSYKVTLTAHPIEGSTTIFAWETVSSSSTPTIPSADGISLDAEGYGTMTIGQSIVYRQFGSNAIEVSKGYYKMGTDSISIECAVEGGFLAGDEITIVGKNGGGGFRNFMIGNGSATAGTTEGNIASTTQSEAKDNSTYTAVMDETNEGGVLRLFRLAGKTMYLNSIKVVRPCTVESGLVLDKTAIDVLDSEKTITAPKLDNPKELVVRYESSNAEIVAVDANTGALTKGTKTGMATITISWERQTINFVRYCAGELVYTVTVKSGATAVENTALAAPAVKVIRDGQLLIIREGKTYTAQGVQVQ